MSERDVIDALQKVVATLPEPFDPNREVTFNEVSAMLKLQDRAAIEKVLLGMGWRKRKARTPRTGRFTEVWRMPE